MAYATCLLLPLKQMNCHKPQADMCNVATLVLLAWMALLSGLIQIINMKLLCTRPWFTGGTGSADQVSLYRCIVLYCTVLLYSMVYHVLRMICYMIYHTTTVCCVILFHHLLLAWLVTDIFVEMSFV